MAAEIIAFKKREKPKTKVIAPPSRRVVALDILRGLCVIGMILVAYAGAWDHRFGVLNHADWHGLALADMIFPGFLFCAGMAMPLSFSGRAANLSRTQLSLHVLWRAGALIGLGILLNFLASRDIGHFRIPGILQRIGLCYGIAGTFCLAVGRKSDSDFILPGVPVLIATLGLAIGYAVMLLLWNAPGCGPACFDSSHSLPAVVDRAVFGLNYMWPYGTTDGVVTFDPEGLVSTLGAVINMLIGVLAAIYIREHGLKGALLGMAFLGIFLFVTGLGLDGKVPIIKKIWTPTFAFVSGGFSLMLFALLALITDVVKWPRWLHLKGLGWPFKVFGGNATLAFVGISLLDIVLNLPSPDAQHPNLHGALYGLLGFIPDARVSSLAYSVVLVVALGLILAPMYHKRWFLKI